MLYSYDLQKGKRVTLEQALVENVKQLRKEQWRAENQAAIDVYHAHVDAYRVFAEGERAF